MHSSFVFLGSTCLRLLPACRTQGNVLGTCGPAAASRCRGCCGGEPSPRSPAGPGAGGPWPGREWPWVQQSYKQGFQGSEGPSLGLRRGLVSPTPSSSHPRSHLQSGLVCLQGLLSDQLLVVCGGCLSRGASRLPDPPPSATAPSLPSEEQPPSRWVGCVGAWPLDALYGHSWVLSFPDRGHSAIRFASSAVSFQ